MPQAFQYTTLAYRYTARFPMLTYVSIQINFWIIANILLALILHMQLKIFGQVFGVPVPGDFRPVLLTAVILGILSGLILGLAGYYFDGSVIRKSSLGRVILFKAVGSFVLLILLLLLLRFVLFDLFLAASLNVAGAEWNDLAWDYLFYLLLIYYFVMTLLISFINQVNRKYGPGVLIPLLLGRYRHPREEERIFMFMDLKSSTATAERLGHLRYSAFLRDCFMDINEVLLPFRAQVYQYVGDEIVVTWPQSEGLRDHSCLRFYFACNKQFQRKTNYYGKHYGVLPEFKAGLHSGKVTAVEIGDLKRDIAYHGDTLNTAARIQSVCNGYNKSLLISQQLFDQLGATDGLRWEALGMLSLKGKTEKVGVVSINSIVNDPAPPPLP